MMKKYSVTVTTESDGTAEAFIDEPSGTGRKITGKIHALIYTKVDYADTVDFTITLEGTGEGVWTQLNRTATQKVYPRVPVHDQVGGAVTYDGSNEIYERLEMVQDRIKIVLAQGGDTKSGAFALVVDEG